MNQDLANKLIAIDNAQLRRKEFVAHNAEEAEYIELVIKRRRWAKQVYLNEHQYSEIEIILAKSILGR